MIVDIFILCQQSVIIQDCLTILVDEVYLFSLPDRAVVENQHFSGYSGQCFSVAIC